MYGQKSINRNPLGIRKVDYQQERRVMERTTSKDEVKRIAEHVWGITDSEVIRFAATMYATGWEAGVKMGVTKTKERVSEALSEGTLRRTLREVE